MADAPLKYEQIHCGHDAPAVFAFSVGQKRQFLLCGLCYALLKATILDGIIRETVEQTVTQAMGRLGYVRGRK